MTVVCFWLDFLRLSDEYVVEFANAEELKKKNRAVAGIIKCFFIAGCFIKVRLLIFYSSLFIFVTSGDYHKLETMDKAEKRRFFYAILFPTIFVAIIWLVKLVEVHFNISLASWGIQPRNFSGLKGIIFMPFLHGDFNHLFNNSIPLLILGSSLFYFYRPVAFKVILWSVLMSGLWTWISARDSFHIGASGLVYSLFGFLFFSGFIRKHFRLIAISFLVAFLYGSMVWGIFPLDQKVSFEGHFWGMFAGIVLAYVYRDKGLKRKPHVWVDEDERAEDDPDAYWNKPLQGVHSPPTQKPSRSPKLDQEIIYHYKPTNNSPKKNDAQ